MKYRLHRNGHLAPILSCFIALAFLQGCDPLSIFRPPSPRVSAPPRETSTHPVSEPSEPPATQQAIMTERKIQEQDLESGMPNRTTPVSPSRAGISVRDLPASEGAPTGGSLSLKESRIEESDLKRSPLRTPPAIGEDKMEALPKGGIPPQAVEEPSLLAKITPGTAPQSALSLRLAEEGRKLLENQEYEKALTRLEKAISIDSRNRFGYYYLARAHYYLGDYRQSLNFLEIVEPTLVEERGWLARVFALKGKNYDALGFFKRADESYARALRLDLHNRDALEGLSRMGGR